MEALTFSRVTSLPDLRMTPVSPVASPVSAQSIPSGDFSTVLKTLVTSATDTVKAGEAAALGGIDGSIPLRTVVDRVMAAERSLQAAVAIRDKLVSSYLEVSRMQV